jgi:hypothetical protein
MATRVRAGCRCGDREIVVAGVVTEKLWRIERQAFLVSQFFEIPCVVDCSLQ